MNTNIHINGIPIPESLVQSCSKLRGLNQDPDVKRINIEYSSLPALSNFLVHLRNPQEKIIDCVSFAQLLNFFEMDAKPFIHLLTQSRDPVELFKIKALFPDLVEKPVLLEEHLVILQKQGYTKQALKDYAILSELTTYKPANMVLFYNRLSSLHPVIHHLNYDGYFIAGGAIVSSLGINLADNEHFDPPPHVDVDIFVENQEKANELLKKIGKKFDCRCFVNGPVITVFVKNEPRCLQIIVSDASEPLREILKFDLKSCQISYANGILSCSQDFLNIATSGFVENVKRPVKESRILKYIQKGITFQYSGKGKIIKGGEDIAHSLNKYYTYTGKETPERLLYMVQTLFNKDYVLLTSPIVKKLLFEDWVSVYGGEQNIMHVFTPEGLEYSVDYHMHKEIAGVSVVIITPDREQLHGFFNVPLCLSKWGGDVLLLQPSSMLEIESEIHTPVNTERLRSILKQLWNNAERLGVNTKNLPFSNQEIIFKDLGYGLEIKNAIKNMESTAKREFLNCLEKNGKVTANIIISVDAIIHNKVLIIRPNLKSINYYGF